MAEAPSLSRGNHRQATGRTATPSAAHSLLLPIRMDGSDRVPWQGLLNSRGVLRQVPEELHTAAKGLTQEHAGNQ